MIRIEIDVLGSLPLADDGIGLDMFDLHQLLIELRLKRMMEGWAEVLDSMGFPTKEI